MSSIDDKLSREINSIPQIHLSKMVEKKLSASGYTGDIKEAAQTLASDIYAGKDGPFIIHGNSAANKDISISFNPQDIKELEESVEKSLDELPQIMIQGIKKSINKQLRGFHKNWLKLEFDENSDFRGFKDRLKQRWGKAITPLRFILDYSYEFGNCKIEELTKSKKTTHKNQLMILLHKRACQTSLEIITLLENGLADGALARWRTLYELTIISMLISQNDEELAYRFIEHEHISAYKELNVVKAQGVKSDEDLKALGYDEKIIQHNYKTTVSEFGKEFSAEYGWATKHLKNKNPRFRHIEEAVNVHPLPPEYKTASYKVHAGISGITVSVGQLDTDNLTLSGASNAGLNVPGILTAHDLVTTSSLLLNDAPDLENIMKIKTLSILRDKACNEFIEAADRLLKEEEKKA